MYLDVSYGWQQRGEIERLHRRRRRNALRLLGLILLLMATGAFLIWRKL